MPSAGRELTEGSRQAPEAGLAEDMLGNGSVPVSLTEETVLPAQSGKRHLMAPAGSEHRLPGSSRELESKPAEQLLRSPGRGGLERGGGPAEWWPWGIRGACHLRERACSSQSSKGPPEVTWSRAPWPEPHPHCWELCVLRLQHLKSHDLSVQIRKVGITPP